MGKQSLMTTQLKYRPSTHTVRWLVVALWAITAAATARAEATREVIPAALPAQGSIEALFTPWDDAEGAIIRVINQAEKTIHVQAYLLTSRSIAKALIAAHARGVTVMVLTDQEMLLNGKSSQIPALAAADIPVSVETRYATAHNKIMLIDAQTRHGTLITGSYNFTWSAQARNAENLLIIRNHPALLNRYLANWQRHAAEAQPYAPLTEANHEQ